jgi:hypothetical protein
MNPLASVTHWLRCTAMTGVVTILASGCGFAEETKPPAPVTSAKAFDDSLVQANVLFKQGKLDEALAAAQAAQKLDPKRFEAPATAALILHAARKPAEAKAALDEAAKLAPPDKQDKIQNITNVLNAESAATASGNSPSLTGTARRQFDTLALIIEEADKAQTDVERKKLLREFLEKSEPFLKENPDQTPIWTLRAVAALELNQAKMGWEAGRKLLEAGAGDSDDLKTRKVLAALERKGWLGKKPPRVEVSAAKSPVTDVPAARPPAEQQPKPLAFSDPARQAALESICGTWEWSDIFSTGKISIKPDGVCTVDWNVMGHYHYDGRITDCDAKGTTFMTSLTEAGSNKMISIPVRKVSADRIKWNGSKFKKRH